jgi:dienelactone hydrolase
MARPHMGSFRSTLAILCLLALAPTIKMVIDGTGSDDNRALGVEEEESGRDHQIWWAPVQSDDEPSKTYLLETAIYRPSGAGPFPLVVIVHGKSGPTEDARAVRPGFQNAAHWFVEHGFAVAVPLRRGYGRSQGDVADLVGTCDDLDYFATALRTARDLNAVIAFMQKQSFIIASQVVAIGHSHGAIGLFGVAYEPPPGLIGVINFAGGTGDWAPWIKAHLQGEGRICRGAEKLVESARKLGERNTLPQLWLYAENDRSFGPALAQAMFKGYSEKSRGPVSFKKMPPWSRDGHLMFMKGEASAWAPAVGAFLAKLHIDGYIP